MTDEKELLVRACELAARSRDRAIYTRTAFLSEGEAAIIARAPLPQKPHFFGGYPEAERCVAVFGEEDELYYPWESDVVILKIAPKDAKFADDFNHRDFLGAVMNLGIKRELLGDLLVFENTGYLFCLEQMVSFLCENLTRVKHTAVKTSVCENLPDGACPKWEEKSVVCPAARVDALISAVWNLSRAEGKELVEKEKVSVFGTIVQSPAKEIKAGERVSVRGYGRFYFDGEERKTKSGKGRMKIRLFV